MAVWAAVIRFHTPSRMGSEPGRLEKLDRQEGEGRVRQSKGTLGRVTGVGKKR